jgi:hypothetical protein
MALISRHHKARRTTNSEFQVVRFLPQELRKILYHYLVFIRPFACMLYRICCNIDAESTLLFSSPAKPKKPIKTSILSKMLREQTISTLGFPIGVQVYRQLSIAITEKHIKQIANPFNQHDDKSKEADINVLFAWQSGHRPLQRETTYGLTVLFLGVSSPHSCIFTNGHRTNGTNSCNCDVLTSVPLPTWERDKSEGLSHL